MFTPTRRKRGAVRNALIAVFAMILAFVAAPTAPVLAANPYERGPAPTKASIEATTGSFATAKVTVAKSSVSGFGGGTIYYPTSTTVGTFGAIALVPGFTNVQSAVAWLGPRVASQGFVVFIIDTNSVYDSPDSRGTQLLAALDYLTTTSTVKSRIDATRLGVMGYSMGGGGALSATKTRTSIKASVPMAPYHSTKTWTTVKTPTLIVTGQNDTTAPPSSHGLAFYNSLPSTLDKAYMELKGATHSAPTSANTTIAKYSISWFKRFIDNDTRYDQFLCPNPTDTTISSYKSTCNYS
ncbi:dienelactone hydrolase family protein [Actinoplanes sp. NPDC026619]|uniref:alpha/beta hydrolase family protein n=1 Tax=Actinoplanes sp. NPDC026619 TaxID=3155798 RepID=UPI00340C47B4